jgi:hypothetical protein
LRSTQCDLANSVTDSGNTLAPYSFQCYAWDQIGQGDTGSSTLTSDGHVYDSDTIVYV